MSNMTYVVAPAGDGTGGATTNGGGFTNNFTGAFSAWHDGTFGPIVSATAPALSEGTTDFSTGKAVRIALDATNVPVGVLVYCAMDVILDSGNYEVLAVDTDLYEWIEISCLWEADAEADCTACKVGGALLNLNAACALWVPGDVEVMVGPGTHIVTDSGDTIKTTITVTPEYNNWLRIHAIDINGNRNPATKPKLDAQGTFAGSCAMINLNGKDYTMITGLELDGNDITNVTNAISDGGEDAAYAIVDQCSTHNVRACGLLLSASTYTRVIDCESYDNNDQGIFIYGDSLAYGCKVQDNAGEGLVLKTRSKAINCLSYGNANDAPFISSSTGAGTATFINCIASGPSTTASGFDLLNNATATTEWGVVLKNCIAMNLGYGFNFGNIDDRNKGIYMDGCIDWNSTYGPEYWASKADSAIYIRDEDYVTGTEMLLNGGFDSDSGWTVNGVGTAIDDGVLTMTGTSATKYFERTTNDVGLVAGGVGKYYALKYTVVSHDGGGTVTFTTSAQIAFPSMNLPQTQGTHTLIFKSSNASAAVDFRMVYNAASGSIVLDNISIKEIDPDAFFSHYLGGNNRVTEPPFVDADNDDYRLKAGHPNFALLYDKTTGTLNAPLGPKSIGGSGWNIVT